MEGALGHSGDQGRQGLCTQAADILAGKIAHIYWNSAVGWLGAKET